MTSNTPPLDTKKHSSYRVFKWDSWGRRKIKSLNSIDPNNEVIKFTKHPKTKKIHTNPPSTPFDPVLPPKKHNLPCPSLKGEMCPEVNCSTGDCPVKPFLGLKFQGVKAAATVKPSSLVSFTDHFGRGGTF